MVESGRRQVQQLAGGFHFGKTLVYGQDFEQQIHKERDIERD